MGSHPVSSTRPDRRRPALTGARPRWACGTLSWLQSSAYIRFHDFSEGNRMADVRLGAALWSQATDWSGFLGAAQRAERLRLDHVWTWDHVRAIFGDPDQPIFEGYTALAAVAQATERIRLGLFVGANTFRNPGLVAKAVATIDHISNGRAMMGLGGAWFETEHRAFGIDFGSGFGERLDWLAETGPGGATPSPGGGGAT